MHSTVAEVTSTEDGGNDVRVSELCLFKLTALGRGSATIVVKYFNVEWVFDYSLVHCSKVDDWSQSYKLIKLSKVEE